MRSKGGFIYIKINKPIDEITADDFDKKVFRDIVTNKISKPLIFESKYMSYVFNYQSINVSEVGFIFSQIMCANGSMNIESQEKITINYVLTTDTLTFAYNYSEV